MVRLADNRRMNLGNSKSSELKVVKVRGIKMTERWRMVWIVTCIEKVYQDLFISFDLHFFVFEKFFSGKIWFDRCHSLTHIFLIFHTYNAQKNNVCTD